MATPREDLIQIYTDMVRSRLLDQKFVEMSNSKKIIFPRHSGEGCGKAGQMLLPVSNRSPHIRIRECAVGGR